MTYPEDLSAPSEDSDQNVSKDVHYHENDQSRLADLARHRAEGFDFLDQATASWDGRSDLVDEEDLVTALDRYADRTDCAVGIISNAITDMYHARTAYDADASDPEATPQSPQITAYGGEPSAPLLTSACEQFTHDLDARLDVVFRSLQAFCAAGGVSFEWAASLAKIYGHIEQARDCGGRMLSLESGARNSGSA